MSMSDLPESLVRSWLLIFRAQKEHAEKAIEQLGDAELHAAPAPGMNSVAVIMKHVSGNMRSRWTDWLTTDGEKPERNRDDEFVEDGAGRDEICTRWERGWNAVFDALGTLSPDDLTRTVTIRGEPHSIPDAVNRQISHYGYHVGQIVTFSRILVDRAGREWRHITIPPGGSKAFNAGMREKHGKF